MSTQSFVKELLGQQERKSLELLEEWNVEKILKTICAFLNTDGGWIVVGYNGKNVVGVSNLAEQAINQLKQRALEQIFPQPLVYVQTEEIGSKKVILVNVLKGSRQPYAYKSSFFIRSNGKTKEANPDDIGLILRTPNEYISSWEKLTTIDAVYSDLDENEILSTIHRANDLRKANSLPNDPQGFLNYFQLIDYNKIKNGAIVLFGIEPAKFFLQCRVRITIMPEGSTGDSYRDVEIIEDNILVSFNKVLEYLRRNIPIVSEFYADSPLRTDRKKYPFSAIDEAIVNAMVHRDYGDMSGEITINIHQDKIEIINSGEIPSDIIKSKNKIESHHSVLRNPMIAHMFFLTGKMEKLGRGLSLIKKQFDELGLKSPEWTFQSGYTKLTLYGVRNEISVNRRMLHFLVQAMEGKSYTREDYLEIFADDIKERTARLDLEKLVDGGWFVKIGDGPATRYSKTSKKLPDITG